MGELLWVFGLLPIEVSPKLAPPLPVAVRICVREPWIVYPPSVWIADDPSWLKRGDADWHVFDDRQVCYELSVRWSEHFIRLLKLRTPGLEGLAAQWLTRSTAYLLQVHYVCSLFGIDEWPEKVAPSWAHNFETALEQYREERLANHLKIA